MLKKFHFWLIAMMFFYSVATIAKQPLQSYPMVKPWVAQTSFQDVERAGFERKIVSASGVPLYVLRCHQGGYDEDTSYAYSGLLDCWLQSLLKDDPDSLLRSVAVQSSDWETRGRFLVGQLEGSCGLTPEWGRKRSFRVRGMRLLLEISDLKYDQRQMLKSYRLKVVVANEPAAVSPISEKPRVPQPAWFDSAGGSCSDLTRKTRRH